MVLCLAYNVLTKCRYHVLLPHTSLASAFKKHFLETISLQIHHNHLLKHHGKHLKHSAPLGPKRETTKKHKLNTAVVTVSMNGSGRCDIARYGFINVSSHSGRTRDGFNVRVKPGVRAETTSLESVPRLYSRSMCRDYTAGACIRAGTGSWELTSP